MRKSIKRIVAMALLLVMLVALVPLHADAAITENASLIKLTDSYTSGSGTFTLKTDARLFVLSETAPSEELQQTAELISSEFAAAGLPSSAALPLVWGTSERIVKGDIILKLVSGIAADGYCLTITADSLTISAADTDGLLNGAFMAIKHFRVYKGTEIPACTVKDEPDTKERTVMLDCARKYWSVDWIKNLIRQMAWMGYNTLELHMTEDQGIRMNIWQDSQGNTVKDCNGNDFSWICGYTVASWAESYQDPNAACFYNADEITEIVKVAQEYHIEIIPGVDVPGHCDHLISQYTAKYAENNAAPTFYYNGTTYKTNGSTIAALSGSSRSTQTIDISNDYARNLTLAIIQAYAAFFGELGCNKFNIGCDEVIVSDSNWKTWANQNNNLGITNCSQYDAFVIYTNLICDMLQTGDYNYTVRAFNDYIYDTKKSWPTNDTQEAPTSPLTFDSELEICWWEKAHTRESTDYSNGRPVYNCLLNYCYYVLRCNETKSDGSTGYGDARSPSNYNWGFHHSTEQLIFEEWNPGRMYEYNADSSSNMSPANLGGGYFLIWGDWAGWNTEVQVWNGLVNADDSSKLYDTGITATAAGNDGGTYNLIDRMWSNSIKMWNWDVDSTSSSNGLSYSDYWPLRNLYRLYPGFTAPSSAPSIPAASSMHPAADFTELKAQIDLTPALDESEYTTDSYAAYQSALSAAKAVYSNTASTQTAVDAAASALKEAFDALVAITSTKVIFKTMRGEKEEIIQELEIGGSSVKMEVSGLRGYHFLRIESTAGDAAYQPLKSGAEGGVVSGKGPEIVLWYENDPQLVTLEHLLAVDDSAWSENNSAYQTEKQSAVEFYNRVKNSPKTETMQKDIDDYVNRLVDARSSAVVSATETKIISLETTTDSVPKGKSAVVLVTTSPDVNRISIEGVTFSDYEGKLTVTDTGEQVKIWYLSFVMTTASEKAYTYTVTASSGSETVTDTFSIVCY